jgi:hypothetical protein
MEEIVEVLKLGAFHTAEGRWLDGILYGRPPNLLTSEHEVQMSRAYYTQRMKTPPHPLDNRRPAAR